MFASNQVRSRRSCGSSRRTAAHVNAPVSISVLPCGVRTLRANTTARAARLTIRVSASVGDRTPDVRNTGSSMIFTHSSTDPGTWPARNRLELPADRDGRCVWQPAQPVVGTLQPGEVIADLAVSGIAGVLAGGPAIWSHREAAQDCFGGHVACGVTDHGAIDLIHPAVGVSRSLRLQMRWHRAPFDRPLRFLFAQGRAASFRKKPADRRPRRYVRLSRSEGLRPRK